MKGVIVSELYILYIIHGHVVDPGLLSVEWDEGYDVAQRSDRQLREPGNRFPGEVDRADADDLVEDLVVLLRLVWTHFAECKTKALIPYLGMNILSNVRKLGKFNFILIKSYVNGLREL